MFPKVNISEEDQITLSCSKCQFKCKLNIQLKKHTQNKHKEGAKYNCNECGFSTDMEHTLSEHPDKSFQFTQEESENMLLKLVAEQNADIVDENNSMKEDIKGAFEKLVNVVDTAVSSIKNDTNNKCKTLADTVTKLYGKIENLATRTKDVENPKIKQRRLAGNKELTIKAKPTSKNCPQTKANPESKKTGNMKVKANTNVPKSTVQSKAAASTGSSSSSSASNPEYLITSNLK